MGRFGPFVQIGTKDDEDKPRFAGLRPGQKMDAITLAEAIELFKLPRKLGVTADGRGDHSQRRPIRPLREIRREVRIAQDRRSLHGHSRARARGHRGKEIADANRLILDFPDAGIQVLNGRYGPYITDKARNAKIPKDRDPKSLKLDECQALLAAAPARPGARAPASRPRPQQAPHPAAAPQRRSLRARPPRPPGAAEDEGGRAAEEHPVGSSETGPPRRGRGGRRAARTSRRR